jgi:LysM repeat protein
MGLLRYRGRHLKRRPVSRGPAAVGAATAVWMAGSQAAHAGTHVVRSGETLSGIAARYGTTVEVLARANRLSNPNYIVTGQHITIPVTATMTSSHVIQAGETLSDIAARYGTSVGALVRANHLRNPNFIVAGTSLKVPDGSAPVGVSSSGASTHVVRRGETLSGIAVRYETSVGALARANHLRNPNFIVAGTSLKVPGGSAPVGVSSSGASTHVVQPGETLSGIAARYGTSAQALARANNLADPGFIVAGTTLNVPGGGSGSSASTPVPASSTSVQASLERHAAGHNVDASLVKAMAWQESGWQQDVVSEAGAIGVMQVMPATARYVNGVLGEGNLDVRTADDNIHLGVRYLRHLLDTMPSERDAIAAYLAGPGNIGKKLTREQRRYVRAVQSHRPRFR